MRRSAGIFAVTSTAAFGVNAATHLLTLWTGKSDSHSCKATLHYRSAVVGDSVLIPLANVLLDQQLQQWKRRRHVIGLDRSCWVGRPPAGMVSATRMTCLAVALTLTLGLHAFQARARLTNWTMPVPWRWTPLGYYHAAFMATQMSFLAYVCTIAAAEMRQRGGTAALTGRTFTAGSLLCCFLALLYKDYY